ncbi:amidohydrolase [Microbacterium sp.]|uniref:amidohydrolase family protein n=1 Tax=Microbacterium sp. TaxID=51671 RepID=UPI002732F16E|nr:amidohydrolase family protein [Microbacterium sp.]MDP3949666.1 amidohydrolase family protein [Microbacterium sp.]
MIDTHLHVWARARSSYRWLDDAPESLRADHSLEEGLAATAAHGFDRAVLVQADETLDETHYLLELAATDPRVAGAVCYLPLEDPALVVEQLPRMRATPGFVGVRNLTHDRPDADWILGAAQRRSLAYLEEFDVPLDYIAVSPRHIQNLTTLALEHPGLTIVLDHLGKPPVGLLTEYDRWADQLAEVAALHNVIAKISGIYPAPPADLNAPVTAEQMEAILTTVLATFGPDRLMLGSDWPMGTVAGGTDAALSVLVAAVDALDSDQADALRQRTATRVYRLQP